MAVGNSDSAIWIGGAEGWMSKWWALGYKPYSMTVQFDPLKGNREQVLDQMRRAIEGWLYPRLCTRFARHPRAKSQEHLLPKLMLFPDMPVWKYKKQTLNVFQGNCGGLHYQGPCLISPVYWRKRCPIELVNSLQPLLTQRGISSVFLREIYDEAGSADYDAKALKRDDELTNHVIVLPRPVADLNNPDRLDSHRKALKDIQSAHNVAEETAQAILNGRRLQRH